ncbi:flagellar hook-length control protein FliK [Alteromonas sp. ALT199]|uniref:flagellar hook-length control protein FliK n=1 Tax=unclassified Alteromonas TaxID=2614992 RepID=UPI001BEAC456|nr:flagellar hook-length control protein FliK [Alteromonas sp. ALT199]MBT3134540.1 flagellar hook-length control protein FliK [Alteromonas sp. ALT199]
MQQVAAHKTDIAALPFSASSTAKAVETGIGTQQQANSENNQAFNRLYQEAKSSKSDFVLNEKESFRSQNRETNRSNNAFNNTSGSSETSTSGKDRDAGHTDLPDEKTVTDIPADSAAVTKEETAVVGSKDIADDTVPTQLQQVGDDDEVSDLLVDSAVGNAEQKSVTEAQLVVGEGGRKDAEAGVITTPGTPDGKPSKDDGEPDWVAYIETVASRFDKGEQAPGASNTEISNRISEVAGETTEVISVKENGKLWKIPDGVDASDAPSVMAHLLSQLNNGSNEGEIAIESLSSEAQQTLSALTALLFGAESEQGGAGSEQSNAGSEQSNANSEANAELSKLFSTDKADPNANELSALIAQLMQQKESADNSEQSVDAGVESASDLDGILANSENSTDESLVLSLLSDELKDLQGGALDEASASEEVLLTEIASKTAVTSSEESAKATGIDKMMPSDAVLKTNTSGEQTQLADSEIAVKTPKDLLTAISELSPQSAQKATEAFAERVVAVMPSGSQQQAVKTNIIAGINEFQQQLQQGREPGIDLSAIVADAAKEAAISSEVITSMTARVDTQASQFLNLMTQTQASAQQVFASMMGQSDTVIQENSQLRAEASKSQQQFEGFDKAVNIHKPEGQQQLNEKIRWMVNARNTMAEIRLDPPEMGSMQVRVNVAGDAASVSFVVQSQQAKDALADAMPKLRDMLSEQGIELGDAQVRKDNSSGNESGQQLAEDGSRNHGDGNRGENDGLDEMDGARVIEQSVTRAAKGGIDFYA